MSVGVVCERGCVFGEYVCVLLLIWVRVCVRVFICYKLISFIII